MFQDPAPQPNQILEIIKVAAPVGTLIISFINLILTITLFRLKDKKEDREGERKIKIDWFKTLILDNNLPFFHEFFENIEKELGKLKDTFMTNKIKVLDLFAGCGGFSKGFELTGRFEIVAANEFWEPAQKTYERNHPNTILIKDDITKNSTKNSIFQIFENEACDVIIGGPPCQAYSNAGFRNPDDPRGKLFQDYVKIVEKLQPSIFVMENVKGILTMEHQKEVSSEAEAKTLSELTEFENERRELLLLRKRHKNSPSKFKFEEKDEHRLQVLRKEINDHKIKCSKLKEKVVDVICRDFGRLGYKVQYKLLNAADYGVPQKRERVIFIGVKDDAPICFPTPTHFPKQEQGNLFTENDNCWVTVREAIKDLSKKEEMPHINHVFTSHSKEFIEKIRATPIGKSVFGGYSDAFYRNPPDEPSRTVKENHGGVLVHYEEERVMTPRELARLQSFPNDFIFEGSKSQVLVQIGNAVPPLLGKAVGEAVLKMLG